MKLEKAYKMPLKEFQDYAWSFYAPGETYGKSFKDSLAREEMDAACFLISKAEDFEGDTVDRERARDLLLGIKMYRSQHFKKG